MHLGATQGLLVGITLAALVALGGRFSVYYFNRQAGNAESVSTSFDACVKRFSAEHPDRFVHKHAGMSIYEIAGKVDATGAAIPCPFDESVAARASAMHDQQN